MRCFYGQNALFQYLKGNSELFFKKKGASGIWKDLNTVLRYFEAAPVSVFYLKCGFLIVFHRMNTFFGNYSLIPCNTHIEK